MGFVKYLLKNNAIAAGITAYSWQDAIREGGKLLLKQGVCTSDYIESIITSCEVNGPYFVIGKGIAMPHTRPEKGALGNGFALVTLSSPVSFGDPENDPIDILIFMAAKSSSDHVEDLMCQIADFCDDENKLHTLRSLATTEDVTAFLKTIKE
ncbi:MAG: PTS sugar transporter subunit IIA [Treponema sp.]|jgi:PTS system ascorbate-specific IIA component|nr:PTS sugar transporter subunit IIA [Treponema sp.]